MDKSLLLFILFVFVSCKNDNTDCVRSEYDLYAIEKTLRTDIDYPDLKLMAPANFDQIIQFHGHDSWGWFDHTIRIIPGNQGYIIQLIDRRKPDKNSKKKITYYEGILSESEWTSIKIKADALYCNKYQLEENLHGVDGDYYNLILKNGDRSQVFFWQMINEENASEEIKSLKSSIAQLVGEMMNSCHFPNGKKIILPNSRSVINDSLSYDIFLSNQYNILNHTVKYNGVEIPLDGYKVATIKIPVEDTTGLQEKIVVETMLLDGSIIEL